MIRVTKFTLEGISLDIASMTVREAEKFVDDGKALLARKDSDVVGEWLKRRDEVIIASLNKAAKTETFHMEQLKDEFDLPTLDALYQKILEFSGLKQGEATATQDSQKSAVA